MVEAMYSKGLRAISSPVTPNIMRGIILAQQFKYLCFMPRVVAGVYFISLIFLVFVPIPLPI